MNNNVPETHNAMTQDPLFELTRSPHLNELINKAKELYSESITELEFKNTVKAVNEFRREMRSMLREQIKYTALTPLMETEVKNLEDILEQMRVALEEIYNYFSTKNKDDIEKGLMHCKKVFNQMFDSIEKIQSEEGKEEKYSDNPLQNELMRMGQGVIKGKIKPEHFNEKLSSLLYSLKVYYGKFDKVTPLPGEADYYNEHKEEIRQALRSYIKALEEASLYFQDYNPLHIESGMEKAKTASEILEVHLKKLAEAKAGPQNKICLQCSAVNPVTSNYCLHCGATLPKIAPTENSEMEFKIDENGEMKTSAHIETEFTKDISDAASSVRSGAISKTEFERILSQKLQKVEFTIKEKEKLQVPDELKTEHEASAFLNHFDTMMVEGLQEVKRGLETMLLFNETSDDSKILFGLEEFFTGSDKLFQLSQVTQAIR